MQYGINKQTNAPFKMPANNFARLIHPTADNCSLHPVLSTQPTPDTQRLDDWGYFSRAIRSCKINELADNFEINSSFQTLNKTHQSHDYRCYFDDNIKNLVEQSYAKDIERFGKTNLPIINREKGMNNYDLIGINSILPS
jgi:hypothetical protein